MPKVLKTGGKGRRKNPRQQEISTFTSKELKTLINGAKNLAQWQTYALLTLQFGLRGEYVFSRKILQKCLPLGFPPLLQSMD